ncbi:hypothetical protein ACRAWD_02165 [Caulobacter segnis]
MSAVALGAAISSSALAAQALPSFAEPDLSPDGSEIAFASGGDLWTVPAAAEARRGCTVTDEATGVATAVFARRPVAGLRLDAFRRGQPLRPDPGHRRGCVA